MTTESLSVTIDGETVTVEIGTVAAPSGGGGSSAWGGITGTLSDQTDLQSALDAKQASSATLTTLASATAAGLALMDDADVAAQRTTLGLGTAAIAATGDFELSGAVATHTGATDPHGDRAYADGLAADYATAAQGALADSATQPGDLATVATTGAYADLSGTPTLGDAAAKNTGTTASTVAAGDDSRFEHGATVLAAGGNITIASAGHYSLGADHGTVTISADDVHLFGNGRRIEKCLMTGAANTITDVHFGYPAATDPSTAIPSTGTGEALDEYICWSKKPARFIGCSFTGDEGSAGNQVGLLIGDQTAFTSTSLSDANERARSVIACSFVNFSVGLCIHTKMEYYDVVGCSFAFNAYGVLSFGGNCTFTGCRAVYNRFGMVFAYPKTSGSRTYSWTSELTAPSTFTTAALANSGHSLVTGCLVNHNEYGITCFESTGAADPRVYGIRIRATEFQANNTNDVRVDSMDWVEVDSCYLRGTAAVVNSAASRIYIVNSFVTTVSETSGGQIYRMGVNAVTTGADDTSLRVYDHTAATDVAVTRGAADSGGAGFRVLRVPN